MNGKKPPDWWLRFPSGSGWSGFPIGSVRQVVHLGEDKSLVLQIPGDLIEQRVLFGARGKRRHPGGIGYHSHSNAPFFHS